MVNLGWLNEDLKSNDWVKVMDQPPVRVMKITLAEDVQSKRDKNFVMEDNGKGESAKTYYVADLNMSKQQELVEASFQMRFWMLEFSAAFGPEQEEWKAAILAELQSFAKLGVYEVVSRADVRGQEILPGRLVLVVKPNPEGEKGKKKARIVVCGNFQTVHQDEMTSSKTPSYPMLRMLLSLASYLADRNMGCLNGLSICTTVWR